MSAQIRINVRPWFCGRLKYAYKYRHMWMTLVQIAEWAVVTSIGFFLETKVHVHIGQLREK